MPNIRMVVSGTRGQVARSLLEQGPARGVDVVLVGRPALDLAKPVTIEPAIAPARPDVIVSAAAMTDSEQAEIEPQLAEAINARGAEALAQCARRLGVPIIQLSTDYVFDGKKSTAYRETDSAMPLNAYGRSKVDGERAVAAAHSNHAILRVEWLYSPFGRNFVKTMLNLAEQRDEVRVVSDQIGHPTAAADVAEGILTVARNLVDGQHRPERYGVFHMAAGSATTWADFATAIFAISADRGGPAARVVPIASSEYPSRVRRLANSQLDCTKIAAVHGVALPPWQTSLPLCIDRILEQRR